MKTCFLTHLAIIYLAIICFGCHFSSHLPVDQKPKVLVSIPPYLSIVSAIAGNTIDVNAAFPVGFDPHTSEITPKQVQAIQKCDLWIGVGEIYEKKLLALLKKRNENIQTIQLSQKIPLLSYSDYLIGSCAHDNSSHHSDHDLHFWLSPVRLVTQAEIICEALVSISPKDADLYKQNLAKYVDEITSLDANIRLQLAPFKKRGIIVSHPFLGYLCHDYNLYQISIECEGKDLRPKDIHQILQFAKNHQIQSIFTSPQFNNKGARLIAKKLGYKTYEVDPMGVNPLNTIEQIVYDITKPP